MASYGVAVMEETVWAVKMAAFSLFCPAFVSFSSFRGYLRARYRNFVRTLRYAYEIAGFFLLFSRSIAFKNALSQLIVLK